MKNQLQIYDTAERKKKVFQALQPKQVKMYCCGPTVYDYLHIGNFRGAVVFNFVRNWLEFLNYKVDFIYNFTDIDDKILNRALKENMAPKDLAEKYITEFKKDYASLKLKAHTHNPRATETLQEIIDLIQGLIEKKKAYEVDGDVFYSISAFKEYGSLSGRNPKELLSGVRIDADPRKKNPLDFALWKKTKTDETWSFESPWGKGRPGWHIECTAMIHKFLGEEIDIHAGGSDLFFPHHENEMAQSTGLNGKQYVHYWMHNNMIITEGDKMSKSLGNMVKMRDFLKDYPGEVFKFLVLSCHYRSPLAFSKKTLEQAVSSVFKIYSSLLKAQQTSFPSKTQLSEESQKVKTFQKEVKKAEQEIEEAFNDDFATPKAFAVLFSLLHLFQKQDKGLTPEEKAKISEAYLNFFTKYGKALSLFQEEPDSFLKDLEDRFLKQRGIERNTIEKIIKERNKAREKKDFKKADELRQKLEEWKIDVKDGTGESRWLFQSFHF